jgi:hypothetical protein
MGYRLYFLYWIGGYVFLQLFAKASFFLLPNVSPIKKCKACQACSLLYVEMQPFVL